MLVIPVSSRMFNLVTLAALTPASPESNETAAHRSVSAPGTPVAALLLSLPGILVPGWEQRFSKTRGLWLRYICLISCPGTAVMMSSAGGGLTLRLT